MRGGGSRGEGGGSDGVRTASTHACRVTDEEDRLFPSDSEVRDVAVERSRRFLHEAGLAAVVRTTEDRVITVKTG